MIGCGLPMGNICISPWVSWAWLWESAWEESPGGDALPFPGGTTFSHCLRVNYRSTDDLSQVEAITQGRNGQSELRILYIVFPAQVLIFDCGGLHCLLKAVKSPWEFHLTRL